MRDAGEEYFYRVIESDQTEGRERAPSAKAARSPLQASGVQEKLRAQMERDRLRVELTHSDRRSRELEDRLEKTEQHNRTLRARLEQLEREARATHHGLQQALTDKAFLEAQLRKKKDLESDLSSMAQSLGLIESRENRQKEQVTRAKKEKEQIEKQFLQLRIELEEARRTNTLYEAEITSLREDLADSRLEAEVYRNEVQRR